MKFIKSLILSALAIIGIIMLFASTKQVFGQSVESRIMLYSGATFDLGSTLEGRSFGLRERNRLAGQHPVVITTYVMGTTVALDFATRYLARHGHPTAASRINFAIGGAHATAGIYNVTRRNQ